MSLFGITVFRDPALARLFGMVGVFLLIASVTGWILKKTAKTDRARITIGNLNDRVAAWWVMVLILAVALAVGFHGMVVLFGLLSFLALREFLTLTPTNRGDHRALFWTFFLITPFQYYLIWTRWYSMFTILIPVYAFLFLPARSAWAGQTERFLERAAKIQWGLMICTYCLSHVPAIYLLDIPGYEGRNGSLLFFFLFVAQVSDVLQYVWGKLAGKRPIAPLVSPNKTLEGFVGGVLSASLLGVALHGVTPFTAWQAGAMSLLITLLGFAGGLVMSAIKRDRGVKDYGTIIAGHGGVLDRLDSICFAAPVFFHVTRYFWTN
jgi:phosphatidate cytidylyltransferase